MASAQGLQYIVQTHRMFTDSKLLLELGLVACPGRISEAMMPRMVAQDVLDALFSFWRTLAALMVAVAHSYSECMPAMAFTQLASDEHARGQGIEHMKQFWACLVRAEARMGEFPFLHDTLHHLDWPVD